MPSSEPKKAQQRILAAALGLFSAVGYHGVSTRDIARVAAVNESSVYRYYPGKRDLFEAVLDAELSKVSQRADLSPTMTMAVDGRAALLAFCELVTEAVLREPALVRLVNFSMLEFGDDLDHVYRRHVMAIMQCAREYLTPCPDVGESARLDARLTVFAFIASFVALQNFYPILAGEKLAPEVLEKAKHSCVNLWCAALTGNVPSASTTESK